ncbi:50S ribosomal protein L18 [Methanothermobacter wolfeii]|uniref:Large ribosomal subunit protein uL18 n=1 Tax=Methanothermobacter wolfeii TaxID=145261 RepID=A0A9E7RTX2_METWO|nr:MULTISPECIES: 50S ribosomal protein L18 [Methanothermobacter]MDI6702382.1 50S ribosomal protein L18 [Methanothermobacter wolfeii]NLM03232.1 50S ribosomal protein L18 [Methanothermobacter wolfeii]QHN06004.1 50S ribosomal protein L18 [Methanothermobacter sp. THM-1]UXH32171.1 50S ribosomal protein L18 [Methanothermobacter wolfeii]SCM56362.1 50S ribosomal protein L18 {ECO:0000255/HAMAP-Rule:MF_01337} [Methanothermobacter wolfeii]
MAHGPRYKMAFRRRREGKTDYRARYKMIETGKPRLVVRITTYHVIAQIINVGMEGDETLVSAHSKQLQKMGWKGATANTAAAYLTGYLCGKRALKAGITEAVLDIGMRPAIRGSKVFAALKGAVDAGLNVPHGEAILPDESRIRGEHIKEYAESLDDEEMQKRFSRYLERGLSPVDLPEHFDEIKKRIDEEV